MKTILKAIFLLNSKKGSLIAHLISLGILSVSGIVLVQYMQGVSSVTDRETRQSDVAFNIHADILSKLRGLLIESKRDGAGKKKNSNKWGICSLVDPPNKQHGVAEVKLKISSKLIKPTAIESFSLKRWKSFFSQSEYSIVDGENCKSKVDSDFKSSPFSYCLKYIGTESHTGTNVYVIARIVPKIIVLKTEKTVPEKAVSNFTKKIDLSKNKVHLIDAKKVIFNLEALVAIERDSSAKVANPGAQGSGSASPISKYYAVVWGNDVTECDVQILGQWTSVQFSGSGVGRTSKKLVINSPFFSSQEKCSEVQFGEMPAYVITSGRKTGKEIKDSIAADHGKNVRLSCRKMMYRCSGVSSPSSKSDSDYDSPILFRMGVFNDSGGRLNFNKLDFAILDDKGKKENTLKVSINNNGRKDDFLANESLTPQQSLNPGYNRFRLKLFDKSDGDNSLTNFCNNVCSGTTAYYPSLTMNFANPPDPKCVYSSTYHKEENKDKYRFRCTVCHSKMCHKVGLGAFGPIQDDEGVQGLVDEPLDGTIPECYFSKKYNHSDYNLPSVPKSSKNCVAMQAGSTSAFKNFKSAVYEYRSCNEQLPVLCFAYGHYFPAISVSSHNKKPKIFKGSFNKAQKACYDMGAEIMNKEKLTAFFESMWDIVTPGAIEQFGLPPGSADHFNYINNATRGLFIVPNYNVKKLSKRLSEGKDSYLQKFLASHNKLWVAMEKDGGGQLIGSIPQAGVAKDDPFAIFTKKESPARPILLKDTNNISDSGKGATILVHNIRYKGVYNSSASGSKKALCRKGSVEQGSGEFVLSDSTNLKDAPKKCRDKGAKFIPPLSSLEWVKALNTLAKNDEMYPFPKPGDFSDPATPEGETAQEEPDAYLKSLKVPHPQAWVALSKRKKGEDKYRAKSWRLSKDAYFRDDKSIFKKEKIPIKDKNYIGLIDYKGKPVQNIKGGKNILSSPEVLLNFVQSNKIKKICASVNEQDQVTGFSAVLADTALKNPCGPKQKLIKDQNLKKYLKSIKFMSLWVTKLNKNDKFAISEKFNEAIKLAKNIKCKKEKKVRWSNYKSFCINRKGFSCPDIAEHYTIINSKGKKENRVRYKVDYACLSLREQCVKNRCLGFERKCDKKYNISDSKIKNQLQSWDSPPYCPP